MISTSLISCIPLSLIGICTYYSPYLGRILQQRRIKKICTRTRTLVLTYDDGPGLDLTPRLLDLLASDNVKSTFFLLGSRAVKNEEIIFRIVNEGHEVGCHSQYHSNAWKTWPWKNLRDIYAGYSTLSPWVKSDGIFRPPHGKMSLPSWVSIFKRGAKLGWWTINSGDTHLPVPLPQMTVDKVKRAGGGVVLMHDYHRTSEGAKYVLQTTELLIKCAKHEGMTIRRLGDLLDLKRKTRSG